MKCLLPFSVCKYSSYKEFLADAYDYAHSKNESFSYEKIASLCSLKSRTHARNIIRGEQKPNVMQIEAIGDLFCLSSSEKKYLTCLLKFSESKNSSAATELFQQMMALLQNETEKQENPFHDVQVMSSLLHVSLLSIFEFNPNATLEVITSMLKNKYESNAIHNAISDLEKLKYVSVCATSGKRKLLQKHIRNYDYNTNFFLKNFHNECLAIAKDSLNDESTNERYLIGANFAINSKIFPRLVQKINAFIEQTMKMGEMAGDPSMVVQLNSQLIKVTNLQNTELNPVLGVKTESEITY